MPSLTASNICVAPAEAHPDAYPFVRIPREAVESDDQIGVVGLTQANTDPGRRHQPADYLVRKGELLLDSAVDHLERIGLEISVVRTALASPGVTA